MSCSLLFQGRFGFNSCDGFQNFMPDLLRITKINAPPKIFRLEIAKKVVSTIGKTLPNGGQKFYIVRYIFRASLIRLIFS